MKRALMIFAKAPVPGFAKTRLIPVLGEQGAADLHGELCARTIKHCVSPSEWSTFLWCAPDQNHAFFQQQKERHSLSLLSQCEGDLGTKMFCAFEQTLQEYDQVVIVGTDCPEMEAARVRQAFAALSRGVAAVVNPADDGGYVLLGLTQVKSELFNGIGWGKNSVWTETRQKLAALGIDYEQLETLWDVDDSVGLQRYHALAMG